MGSEGERFVPIEESLELEQVRASGVVVQPNLTAPEDTSVSIVAVCLHPGKNVTLGHTRELACKSTGTNEVSQRIPR